MSSFGYIPKSGIDGSYVSLAFLKKKQRCCIGLFLAALGLHCCTWPCSSCGEQALLSTAMLGLLAVVASFVVEHRR